MPRIPEPAPTAFAIAASAAIRRLKADNRVSNAEISDKTGLSTNYIAERLRDEKSFTLSDIELLAKFFRLDPTALLVEAARPIATVTPIGKRTNDSGFLDDSVHGLDTAAGKDETQADED